MGRSTKSVAAQAALEAEQDTAAEQLEGQEDALDHVETERLGSEDFSTPNLSAEGDTVGTPHPNDYPEAGVTTGGEDESAGLTEKQKRAKLYNLAERHIIEEHRTEFNAYADQLFKTHGLVFARKRTATEKAADQIAALLKDHPTLRPQFPGLALEADNEGTPEGVHIA